MNNNIVNKNKELVLSIDPASRGFGYTLFEGPKFIVDKGIIEARTQTNKRSLERIRKLIKFYKPDVIVLEDYSGKQSNRCQRVKDLIDQIVLLAKTRKIKVRQYSKKRIYEVFSNFKAVNKHQISKTICEWFPELTVHLPPKRKIWETEDRRMSIFDASSLTLTYFFLEH